MTNRTVIITGGNSGLGLECVKTIVSSGDKWDIVIASRNVEKSQLVVKEIQSDFPNQSITVEKLDLASLQSVKAFASNFKRKEHPPLYGIICNSGIIDREGVKISEDKYDLSFAVNHLGHFLLTNLLLDQLQPKSRIIIVSSNMHNSTIREGKMAPAEFLSVKQMAATGTDNSLDGFRRYTSSKLCNLLFAYELNRTLNSDVRQITVNSFDPGFSPGTGLMDGGGRFRNFMMGSWFMKMVMWFMGIVTSTPKKSGKALARLLLDPTLEVISGKYFQINNEIESSPDSHREDLALDLWKGSEELVG